MSRAERLFDLLDALRRHRRPVSGKVLAEGLGVSLRTLYRDVASLKAQGAPIDGEAGVGFLLRPGFLMPPLMFPAEEIEALALGARWVAQRGDRRLGGAAEAALARIAAVLTPELRQEIEAAALLVVPGTRAPAERVDPALLRRAIRAGRKLEIAYEDAAGTASRRTVWPFGLAFFDEIRMLLAWCELRRDFRHFRTDRIAEAEVLEARAPQRPPALMARWRTEVRGRERAKPPPRDADPGC
jgi:predicted DNA-binding transcriptional regulator YafY